jgi:predicted integral membrane protein DUF2269
MREVARMQWLFPWFLFLHVLAAVVAFGPTFSFSLIGAMAGKEPQHANFATRITQAVSDRLVIPVALTMPITGAGIILVNGINLAAPQYRWLGAAIIVYIVILSYAVLVQRRTVERLVELTSAPPPPGASGPPPEVPAVVRRVQLGGMFLGAGIVLILFLMVVKPGFGG